MTTQKRPPYCCEMMRSTFEFGETGLVSSTNYQEFGIRVEDGGDSFIQLNFCPWCGNKLPPSRREEYFKQLELMEHRHGGNSGHEDDQG